MMVRVILRCRCMLKDPKNYFEKHTSLVELKTFRQNKDPWTKRKWLTI